MVKKKLKHGLYTGNTIRRPMFENVTHKGTVQYWAKYLEYAQSEVEELTIKLLHEDSGSEEYFDYIYALKATFDTLSYLPDSEHFSLDKDKRWEIVERLENDLERVWLSRPKEDGARIFPFELNYTKSDDRTFSSVEHAYNHYGEYTLNNLDAYGKKLPYDESWRRQSIYHNQHRRGIQRKPHLFREKKVSAERHKYKEYSRRHGWKSMYSMPNKYRVEDVYRESRDPIIEDGNPPSVYIHVSRDDTINSKIHSRMKRDSADRKNADRPDRKDNRVIHYGSRYGIQGGMRGVHVISQTRFTALKHLDEHWKHPKPDTSWIYKHGRPGVENTTVPCRRFTHRGGKRQPNKATGEGATRQQEANAPKSKHNQKRVRVNVADKPKGESTSKALKVPDIQTDVATSERGVEDATTDKSKKPSKQERRLQRKMAKKEIRKMYREAKQESKWMNHTNRGHRKSEMSKVNDERKEIKAFTGFDEGKNPLDYNVECSSSLGFFATEPSALDLSVHKKKTEKPKIIPPIKVKSRVESDGNSKVVPRPLVDVPLWQVIGSILDPSKHRGSSEIQIRNCVSKSCSVLTSANNQLAVPTRPLGVRTSKLRTRIKQPINDTSQDGLATDQPAVTTDDKKHKKKRKRKNLRKRKKARRMLSVDEVIQKVPAVDDVIKCGFLTRVKSSTLQASYLHQKYGERYREGCGQPRTLWVDISNMVAEVRNHSKAANETCNIHELPFMNIHAILLVQEISLKMSRTLGLDESINSKSIPHSTVVVQLKCDLDLRGKQEVYNRVRAKVRQHLLYPLPKLIEYFVEVYKVLILEGYLPMEADLSTKSEAATSRIRQYEWLYTLTLWQYDIYSANDAYQSVKNKLHLDHWDSPASPHHVTQTLKPDTNHISTNSAPAITDPTLRTDTSTFTACDMCQMLILLSGDLATLDSGVQDKLEGVSGRRWTVRYSRSVCGHTLCADCLHKATGEQISDGTCTTISCPVISCDVIMDPVVVLSVISLTKYCKLLQHKMNFMVSSHPQWRWCPHPKCDRAAKVGGSAMLEASLVIECFCRHAWCFHCKKDAHWPAACDQSALYWMWSEPVEVCYGYTMGRLLCLSCESKKYTSNRGQKPTQTGVNQGGAVVKYSSGHKSQPSSTESECSCELVFCPQCLNLPGLPINIPKALLEHKTLSLTSSQDALLPMLLFRQAISHHHQKDQWLPQVTEAKAIYLARMIMKSKMSHVPQRAPSLGPGMGRATTSIHMVPSGGTEKLFLSLIFQFVYQAHMFLEFVYVELINPETVTMVTRIEVLELVIRLEQNISQIDKMLSSFIENLTTVMSRLKSLSDTGKSIMSSLTNRMRHLSFTSSPRQSSRSQGQRQNLLPPLDQSRNNTL